MSQFNPNDILAQFNQQQSAAQAAQAAQFTQLIDTIKGLGVKTGGTFDDALDRVKKLGTTARERNRRTGVQTLAAGKSALTSSGLSNTTLSPNLERAVASDTTVANQAVDESVGAQQSNILQNRAGNETQIGLSLANAIGGQNIQGPDLGFFADLLQRASAAGDPNQKTTAFGGINTAALNAPNSAFQRPGGGGGSTAAPGASTFGVTQPGAPATGATVVGNKAARDDNPGGVFGAQGQSLSPAAQRPQGGGGGRTVTIQAGINARAKGGIGSTRTVQIPAGVSNAEATASGAIPFGWRIV